MEDYKRKFPMTTAQMIPILKATMSKEEFENFMLMFKRRPGQSTHGTKENLKIVSHPELPSVAESLKSEPSREQEQTAPATKRKLDSPSKLENKRICPTKNVQMKYNPVGKDPNMASNTKCPPTSSVFGKSRIPKFLKPEYKAGKPLPLHGHNNMSVRGILTIPSAIQNELEESSIYNWDNSVVVRENAIEDEHTTNDVINDERLSADISVIPPPTSTPFKDLMSTKNFFDSSTILDYSSLCSNKTITHSDKPSPKTNKLEDTGIFSLCNFTNEINLTDLKSDSTVLNNLVEFEKKCEFEIKMFDFVIAHLNNSKQIRLKAIETVKKLIQEKKDNQTGFDNTDSLKNTKTVIPGTPSCSKMKRNSKSPLYLIPKKFSSLRKRK